jgi:hypothetical protein
LLFRGINLISLKKIMLYYKIIYDFFNHKQGSREGNRVRMILWKIFIFDISRKSQNNMTKMMEG